MTAVISTLRGTVVVDGLHSIKLPNKHEPLEVEGKVLLTTPDNVKVEAEVGLFSGRSTFLIWDWIKIEVMK